MTTAQKLLLLIGGSGGKPPPAGSTLLFTGTADPQLATWQANFTTGDGGTLAQYGNNIWLVGGAVANITQLAVSAAIIGTPPASPIAGVLHADGMTSNALSLTFDGQAITNVTGLASYSNPTGSLLFTGCNATTATVNAMLAALVLCPVASAMSSVTVNFTTAAGTNPPSGQGITDLNTLRGYGWTVTVDGAMMNGMMQENIAIPAIISCIISITSLLGM